MAENTIKKVKIGSTEYDLEIDGAVYADETETEASVAPINADTLGGRPASDYALAGEGGVSSWNDLTDKPFGEVYGDTLTVDYATITADFEAGNTDGYVFVEGHIKVSDATPTAEDFANGLIVTEDSEMFEIPGEELQAMFAEYGALFFEAGIVAPTDNYEMEGVVFPEAGLYMAILSDKSVNFTLPGYTGFYNVQTIDKKYLPTIPKNKLPTGVVNVQPDWNQTDETADDYIKNKPAVACKDVEYTYKNNCYYLSETSFGEPMTMQRASEVLGTSPDERFKINNHLVIGYGTFKGANGHYGAAMTQYMEFNYNGVPSVKTSTYYTAEYTPS